MSTALFLLSNSKTEQPASKNDQSLLQALSKATTQTSKVENTSTYVHPLVRKSSAKLSKKSLEMCTESLGSETGSDAMELETMTTCSRMTRQRPARSERKAKCERMYPPVLDSVVNIESYRENGRLVMNAVAFMESSNSLFQAERIGGRLKLRLKKGDDEFDGTNE